MKADALEQFAATQPGTIAIVAVGMNGELTVWRHPAAAVWSATGVIREALTRAIYAAPELQHNSGLKK